jgi:hypothetical protein
MSSLDTFTMMTGIPQASFLEVTTERASQIVQTVSSTHIATVASDTLPVNILPVSSYVSQAKTSVGYSNIIPNLPPFATHWGIIVGTPVRKPTAYLLHLILQEDEDGNRSIEFAMNNIGLESRTFKGGVVQHVGETRFSLSELIEIGTEMIEAFGNYHIVFWNCQMFAKCYLRVITGSDAAFSQWTSADVTNLFLCTFVFPSSSASITRTREKRRMKHLHQVGIQAARQSSTANDGGIMEGSEELVSASDEAMDLMKEAMRDEKTGDKESKPVMDSSDKYSLIHGIKARLLKLIGS